MRRLLVLLVAAGACGGDSTGTDGGASSDGGSGIDGSVVGVDGGSVDPPPKVQVTWSPNATFIDQPQLPLVTAHDDVKHVYTIDAAGAKAASLDLSVGRVLVIYGMALRTIKTSTAMGSSVVLTTDPAALTDALTKADIEWQQTLAFNPANAGVPETGMSAPITIDDLMVSQGHLVYTTTVNGIDISITIDMAGDSLTLNLVGEKKIAGKSVGKFTATGMISKMVSQNVIQIDNGMVQQWSHVDNGLTGNLQLDLVAAGSLDDALNFTVPIPLMKFPLVVAFIPTEVDVGCQIVVMGHVPADGSVMAHADFAFDSDLGLEYANHSLSAMGRVGNFTVTPNGVNQTASSGAVTSNFGIGFPDISVSMFGGSLVGSIDTAFLVNGTYTPMPACLSADTDFLASGKVDLSILGRIALGSSSVLLWEKKMPVLRSGMCPP